MENHRLVPMKDGYSVALFNKLYKETESLRKSLVYGIDHRRFGVTKDEIMSWFDDKFIYVFNLHCQTHNPDVLKGFIINSLKTFKCRVLRGAYLKKNEIYSNAIELEGEFNLINYLVDKDDISNEDLFHGLVMEFFKKELNDEAYRLLQLQLNPPPYILSRIKKSNSQIPVKLILEFFDKPLTPKNTKFIQSLRKDIALSIDKARTELSPELALSL